MLTLSPLPTFVTYSDDIPAGVGGYAKLNYVRIRPKYRNTDVGIHRHEYRHVIQFYVALFAWLVLCGVGMALVQSPYWVLGFALMPLGLIVHPLAYTYIPTYKLWCEVEAYREQAKHYPDDRLPKFSRFISERYGLRISTDEALKLLRQESSR